MGVWYRTIATSASTALTLCFVMAGEVMAAPTTVTVAPPTDAEVAVAASEVAASESETVDPVNTADIDETNVAEADIAEADIPDTDGEVTETVEPEASEEISGAIASDATPTPSAPTIHSQSDQSPVFDDFSVPGFDGDDASEPAPQNGADKTSEPTSKDAPRDGTAAGDESGNATEDGSGDDSVGDGIEGTIQDDAATEEVTTEDTAEPVPAETLDANTGSDDGVPTADLLQDGDLSPLETNPNPLHYPTLPEEVRVVIRQPITLEQALELARRNSRTLESARLNLEQAQEGLKAALAARYPQLNLTGTLLNTLAAGTRLNLLQANDTTRRAGGNDIVDDPADRNADTTNYTLSLQLTYNIYSSGQRLNQVRAARAQVKEAEFAMEAAFEDVRFNVTNAYYILQQETEQLKIDEVSVGFRQQNVKDAEALEKAGLGTRFEVLQAEVELANDRQTVEQTQSRLTQARRELARQLSLPEVIDINAADPIQKVGDWNLNLEDSILTAYRNRAELAQQLAQRDEAEALRRVQRAQDGPQLDAIVQYDLFDVLEAEDNFGPVYGYSASLQFSWSLFDGGANRAEAAQQDSLRRAAENQFAIQREEIRFDVEQSYANLVANTASIRTALQAIEAAEEEVRLARLRFRAGVGTQTDRLNAETRFIRARGNVLLAIVGYNQAVSSLMRAVSNLPPGTVTPSADPVSLPELTVEEVLDSPPSSFRDTGDIFTPIPSAQPPAGQ